MYTQANRPIGLTTPLGTDKLLLERFAGSEAISRPFHFLLTVLAQPGEKVDFANLLGQKACVRLDCVGDAKRFFHGTVTRLSEAGAVRAANSDAVFLCYHAELMPQFALLRNQVQSRIFQQLTVPDILKKVLTGLEVKYEVQGTYEPRDYCVQYRESDFDFASRLMEEEGIFYFFKHEEQKHTMVVADAAQSHPDANPVDITYNDFVGLRDRRTYEDRIVRWAKSQQLSPGKWTLWDHSFEMPDKNLESTKPILETITAGTVDHKLKVGGNDKWEVYDYPGGYAGRFDGVAPGGGDQASHLSKIDPDGDRTVNLMMQHDSFPALSIQGDGNVRSFYPGAKFNLKQHYDGEGNYVLTEVGHQASMEGTYTTGETVNLRYGNTFRCIPAALPFRPARNTPKPKVYGTQTAVVVGPSGNEIFTDKYGRVKVQFFWDRDGKKDANSSCWVRVAQPWAGKQWGAVFLPRVGHEVLVTFLEGDPDQPIIVGSVYNAENMPPYTLPDEMTKSTIKSRTSANGAEENFNEIRFEDKKGEEEILIHAEKNMLRFVENNDEVTVGFDKKDPGDQKIDVYNDRTVTIDQGNNLLKVKKGNRTVEVDQGDDVHAVKTGNRTVEVDKGNDVHTVKTGNREVVVEQGNATHAIKMGKSSTEAMQAIELKVGDNSIVIDQKGITIKGMMVAVEGQAKLDVGSPMTTVKGDGMLTVQGGLVKIN